MYMYMYMYMYIYRHMTLIIIIFILSQMYILLSVIIQYLYFVWNLKSTQTFEHPIAVCSYMYMCF